MKLKKLLSMIIVCAIMITSLIIPASAVGDNEVIVHFYNENNWQSPCLYYYADGNNPVQWPGVAMTSEGDGWYGYTISSMSSALVIFSNNGSNQDPAQNEPGYSVSGEKWYKNGTFYNSEPEESELTVHYYNYYSWNVPYIYYYTDGSNPVTWPGAAMTADGDGWYTYEISGYDSARVVFSNNGSSQDPGQNQPGYLVSAESWYRNGTWTTSRPEGITVYFYKPSNWSAPNIYYYLNNNDTGPAWPGTAMEEVSEGWYSYNITKYDSAKVMFNDGTNQIPAQNQPGLDAEGIMWYKNGIWCDDESDTDEDELPDYMELILGTNINSTDSDNDNLPDGYEVMTLGTDPTLADSDSNNISDAAEDADSDGLNNLTEYQLGTNPMAEDSDNDDLTDSAEVSTYYTDPTDEDTDGDGANDGWEVLHSTNPIVANSDFDVTVALGFRDDDVAPSVTVEDVTGEQAQSLSIEEETANSYYINDTVGAIGSAYDFSMTGEFDSAEISFEFDSDLLLDPDFDPVIYWFDEENQELVPLTTTVTGNVASAEVDHFSLYTLLNRYVYEDSFTWIDDYQINLNYNSIEMVVIIDDSETTIASQGNYNRETAAIAIDASLPTGSKTGIIRVSGNNSTIIADGFGNPHMYNSGYLNVTLQSFQAVTQTGQTSDLSLAISDAVQHFSDNIYTAKFIVLLSDGLSYTGIDSSQYEYLTDNQIKIMPFAIGNNVNGENYLKSLATNTGGTFYHLQDYSAFASKYSTLINIDIDNDSDGLPDYYESNIPIYNGGYMMTDTTLRDTDGDTLADGEEILISRQYIPMTNNVRVTAVMRSDPRWEDSDFDLLQDSEDYEPLKYNTYYYYDRDSAIQYAGRYAYNPNIENYPYFSEEGDCANFVSQCIYAGGLRKTDDWYFYSKGYQILGKWIFDDYSTTWTVAHDQYDYFRYRSEYSYHDGIEFNSYEDMCNKLSSGEYSIQPGDLIYFQWEYSNPHHAAIVSDITNNDVYYAAHTDENYDAHVSTFFNKYQNGKVYIICLKDLIITS